MLYGFVFTIIAGLTSLFGFFITFKKYKNPKRVVTYFLSLTFVIMIFISIFDLSYEAIINLKGTKYLYIIMYILFNFIIFKILIKLLNKLKKLNKKNDYVKIGVINTLVLFLHNLPEGIITFISAKYNLRLGIKIFISIILHNIPEGISIAIPSYYGSKSRKLTLKLLLIAAIAEPFGALISFIFIKKIINRYIIGYVLLSISIIMILISIEEIYPKIREGEQKSKYLGFLSGTLLFILIKFFN